MLFCLVAAVQSLPGPEPACPYTLQAVGSKLNVTPVTMLLQRETLPGHIQDIWDIANLTRQHALSRSIDHSGPHGFIEQFADGNTAVDA